jgi:L-ascorbate metabolism protein UlaG (beta-lactamase superfamily)
MVAEIVSVVAMRDLASIRRFVRVIGGAVLATFVSSMALAQTPAPPAALHPLDAPQSCPGLVAANRPRVIPAALSPDQVRITYVGHATFLIESPELVRIATDYNDYVRPPVVPDIATMNHAHSTHYTDNPDPAIKYVLRGWGPSESEPANWDVKYKDVRVRNVPTNIRNWMGGTERYGNSIFVFEMANLCIAHLGHLHHTLTQQQLDEIGKPDVVMAPVDGNLTLDLDGMMEVLSALKPQIIVPMHFFNPFTLARFLDRAAQNWPVEHAEIPSFVVSKTTLPDKPKVLVLPGH